MKTLFTFIALLATTFANCQVAFTSVGLNSKIDRFDFKDSKMIGFEYTLQSVLNEHFLISAEYSKLGRWSLGNILQGPELGTFSSEIRTIGGNIGYRFTPHEKFAIDLTTGLFHYNLKERIVYDTVYVPNGWFPYYDAVDKRQEGSGLGGSTAVRVNWIVSRYVGFNLGCGVQSHQHTEPYIQIGLELGLLR